MKTISDLELHYQEFIRNSQGSEMFGDDDKRKMQSQFTDAQKHYQTLVIQLPGYPQHQTGLERLFSLLSTTHTALTESSLHETAHTALTENSFRINFEK